MAKAEKDNLTKNYFWDNLGVVPCSLDEAGKVAMFCWGCGDVPLFVAETGIGKSQKARQLAAQMGWDSYFKFLAHLEPEDLTGVPYPDNGSGTYSFLCEKNVRRIIESQKRTLIVLDELNRCEKVVANGAFTMMEDRQYGGHPLPHHIFLMGCMNPSEENYLVNEFEKDPAFRRRLCFIGVQLDAMVWLQWATGKTQIRLNEEIRIDPAAFEDYRAQLNAPIHPYVTDYIRVNPSVLVDIQGRDAGKISTNPASWDKVSRTLQWMDWNKMDLGKYMTTFKYKTMGHIGFGQTDSFMSWIRDREALIDPSLVFKYPQIQGKVKYLIKEGRNDRLTILIDSLSLLMVEQEKVPEDKELGGFISFVKDLPLEFAKALFQKIDNLGTDNRQGYSAKLSIGMQGHPELVDITRSIFGTGDKIEQKFKSK